MLIKKPIIKKMILVILLLLSASLSYFKVSEYVSSPQTHAETIKVLDEKKLTAVELTTSVATTSVAISAIPGDATTPIANQISGLTPYLLVVVSALFLEKFLLTITGFVAFRYLIPITCLLLGIYIFYRKDFLAKLAFKLAIFAVAITLIIPASVKVTTLIESTFHESMSQTFNTVEEITEEAEKDDTNSFWNFLNNIGNGIANLTENAKKCINVFIDAVAVLVITTCVIPILVLFFFVWILKILFSVNIDLTMIQKMLPVKKKTTSESVEK